jgi:beta-lactamase class A
MLWPRIRRLPKSAAIRRIVVGTLVYSLLSFVWAVSISFGTAPAEATSGVGQACNSIWPSTAAATFSWPRAAGAYQVWLDVSLFDNGFLPGSFAAAGPFSPDTSSYTWQGLSPGLPHYYRVNALYPNGWHVVKSGSFVTGQCQGAASIQWATQECSTSAPGKVKASFSWAPSLATGAEQFLDLSVFDVGFAPATFTGMGPLAAGESSYAWDGLEPGVRYYWRVNTRIAGVWQASQTGSFMTLSCGTSAVLGSATGPSPGLLQLRDRLAARIADSGIDAAVAVTDLQTGESIDVNGDTPRLAGCTINWFVLLSVVIDLQESRYPESDVGDLIAQTIYGSNPITARTLLLKTAGSVPAGVYKINAFLARLGLGSSVFDHPPAYPNEFSLRGSANIVTANDINRALTSFYQGAIVNMQWRDYLLDKMTGVKPGLQYLIPAGVGYGTVSHKNGFSWADGGWIDNDIGIVTFDSGGATYAYAISFFTQGVPTKYDDIPLGQAVSSMAWEYFANRY